MRSRLAALVTAALLAASCASQVPPAQAQAGFGTPERIAPGIEFYTSTDASLVAAAGPIAVYLLRLDPARVRIASVLSNDEVVDAEPVAGMAARHHAVAAINGGYFNRANGEPVALLKTAGELVSDSPAIKGAVLIRSPAQGATDMAFDRISARVTASFDFGDTPHELPVDGVDTTRERGKLMLYTPSYHGDTDTAPTGTEWTLDGSPLRVVDVRPSQGHTPIPRTGAVLSYGGVDLPEVLADLIPGTIVTFKTTWKTLGGTPADDLDRADHIVNGAGLLRRRGQAIADWQPENLSAQSFTDARHPRTLIGKDTHGTIWLAAVDGRQPDYSIGMTFADLQRLCDRLGLTDALNLDGGGSTTMVVTDRIVNRPSDVSPRPVSDAILVTIR